MSVNTWTYALDDTSLREGEMTPVYPLGVNVVLARVSGSVYTLSGPVPADLGGETLPAKMGGHMQNIGRLMKHIRTESIGTYDTKVEAGWVHVAL